MYQKQNKIFAQLGKALVKQRLTPSTNKTVFSSARLHLAHKLQHSYNERILIERTEFHHQKPVSLIPFKGILSWLSDQHFQLSGTILSCELLEHNSYLKIAILQIEAYLFCTFLFWCQKNLIEGQIHLVSPHISNSSLQVSAVLYLKISMKNGLLLNFSIGMHFLKIKWNHIYACVSSSC